MFEARTIDSRAGRSALRLPLILMGAGLLLLACLAGCASPGSPRPPTLRLPEKAKNLQVKRVGDQVRLTWTTSANTTDGDAIKGGVTAVVCQEMGRASATPSGEMRCDPAERAPVTAGASEVAFNLPAALLSGAPVPLGYRVELLNSRGRSAGVTDPVYTASGPAPRPAGTLSVTATRAGALLTWTPSTGPGEMQVLRSEPAPTGVSPSAKKQPEATGPILRPVGLATGRDPGGMLDRSVRDPKLDGMTYRYVAQRMQELILGGRHVALYGIASEPVDLTYRDTFTPDAPLGLVAIPSLTPPSIDLSWDAAEDGDVTGYNVYRSSGESPAVRLNVQPVPLPAFRDSKAESGVLYTYTVTAVTRHQMESARSQPVRESFSE